jgi:hypothetical protein
MNVIVLREATFIVSTERQKYDRASSPTAKKQR